MDPVIVAGAGPVGLSLALALTRRGVPVIVLDEGTGHDEARPARTAVLRPDTTGFLERLGCLAPGDGVRWTAWRTMRRSQELQRTEFAGAGEAGADAPVSPLHLPQHTAARRLRAALAEQELAQVVTASRLDLLEQDGRGVSVHTRDLAAPAGQDPGRDRAPGEDRVPGEDRDRRPGGGTWWRGSHLVGCDGSRSTVRKLLQVRFAGRTAVERHAVAVLRAELPWPGEAVLHRAPPRGGEAVARPLPDGAWRIDWLLPPRGDLVTPEALVGRIRDTLAAWCGRVPPYDLVDTGVHTVHHRLARRWRDGRVFLAGDAAHLLGALGTQGLDEGLRDAGNLAWKLALAWHRRGSETLLDSYQTERRGAVGARLRAADQALPLVRGRSGWPTVRRTLLPGGHETLRTDGHLGRGPLGAPPVYARSPLTPPAPADAAEAATAPGEPVADVAVTVPADGSAARLRDRLGAGMLVVLVAPGTGVWERRHWMSAGLMPRLAAAVDGLPVRAELLVAEDYPGAAAHTVLLVRPDGHLVAAMAGVRPGELYAYADAARGGPAVPPRADGLPQGGGTGGDGGKPPERHGGPGESRGGPGRGAAAQPGPVRRVDIS